MIGRIRDAAQSDRLMTALQTTTTRLRNGQIAAATGKRATRYDQIARESGLLLRTKDQRALTGSFKQQNEQVVDRLTAMDGALANLGDIAQRLRTLLTQRLDAATGDLVPLDREALTLQAEAAAQLNIRLDERYLFAGSRSDVPPVELPATTLTSPDPALYFHGDTIVQTVRADRDVEVPYGMTADDPAFGGLPAALGKRRKRTSRMTGPAWKRPRPSWTPPWTGLRSCGARWALPAPAFRASRTARPAPCSISMTSSPGSRTPTCRRH